MRENKRVGGGAHEYHARTDEGGHDDMLCGDFELTRLERGGPAGGRRLGGGEGKERTSLENLSQGGGRLRGRVAGGVGKKRSAMRGGEVGAAGVGRTGR